MGKAAKKLICEGKENYFIKPLLTHTEFKFYSVLCSVLQGHFEEILLLTKIRIADILEPGIRPKDDYKMYRSLFGRIGTRHFDFVLCNRKTMKVLCVIELNDSSHNTKKVRERDEFVRKACKVAGLKIFMFDVSEKYSTESLKVIFNYVSGLNNLENRSS